MRWYRTLERRSVSFLIFFQGGKIWHLLIIHLVKRYICLICSISLKREFTVKNTVALSKNGHNTLIVLPLNNSVCLSGLESKLTLCIALTNGMQQEKCVLILSQTFKKLYMFPTPSSWHLSYYFDHYRPT
jgi:hypothetical protein